MTSLVVWLLLALCEFSLGVTVIPVPASCTKETCLTDINKALAKCVNVTGGCTVELFEGTYELVSNSGHSLLYMIGLKNATLKGVPGKTILSVPGLHVSVVAMYNGANCTIEGITIDMPRPPYTLCTVVHSNKTSSICSYDKKLYPFPTPITNRNKWFYHVEAALEFDTKTWCPPIHALDMYCERSITNVTDTQFAVDLDLKVGHSYIFRHQLYGHRGIDIEGSNNTRVKDVTIHTIPGMGLVINGFCNVTVDNFRLIPKTGYAMSSTVDGTHYGAVVDGGFVHVRNSYVGYQGDDGMNIMNKFTQVLFISADHKTIRAGRRGKQPAVPGRVGDMIDFYSRHNLTFWGRATISAIHGQNISFSTTLPKRTELYDLMINTARNPSEAIVSNTTFHCNRARNLLLSLPNFVVENSHFFGSTGPAILVSPDAAHWFEGDIPYNVTIINNTFAHSGYGVEAVYLDGTEKTFQQAKADAYNYRGHTATEAYGARPNRNDFSSISIHAQVPYWKDNKPVFSNGHVDSVGIFYNYTIKNNQFRQLIGNAALAAWGIEISKFYSNDVGIFPGGSNIPYDVECTNCTIQDKLKPNTCHNQANAPPGGPSKCTYLINNTLNPG